MKPDVQKLHNLMANAPESPAAKLAERQLAGLTRAMQIGKQLEKPDANHVTPPSQ
jgi:hypothetical protein